MAKTKGKVIPRRPRRRRNPWLVLAAAGAGVVVAGVIIAVMIISQGGGDGGDKAPPDITVNAVGRTLGNASAPVTIIEYADFQCPWCKRAAANIMPQIERDFIEPGKASLEFRHYPIVDRNGPGKESHWAAYAAECANEQGKFWEYYQTLFANQKGENEGDFTKPKLEGFAKDLGLNEEQFNSCLESEKYSDVVAQMQKEGEAQGVTGTPTFFINGVKLQAADYSSFKRAIEQALRNAE